MKVGLATCDEANDAEDDDEEEEEEATSGSSAQARGARYMAAAATKARLKYMLGNLDPAK